MPLNRDDMRTRMNPRREDGSWNAMPVVIGVAVLAFLAYMAFGSSFTNNAGMNRTPRADAPISTPGTTPAPRPQ